MARKIKQTASPKMTFSLALARRGLKFDKSWCQTQNITSYNELVTWCQTQNVIAPNRDDVVDVLDSAATDSTPIDEDSITTDVRDFVGHQMINDLIQLHADHGCCVSTPDGDCFEYAKWVEDMTIQQELEPELAELEETLLEAAELNSTKYKFESVGDLPDDSCVSSATEIVEACPPEPAVKRSRKTRTKISEPR